MHAAAPDPRALGNLLLIQGCVQLIEDERELFSVITRGLALIPGIASAKVCVEGRHDHEACHCPAREEVPIDTIHRHFGRIVMEINDPDGYRLYAPFVRNLAGTLALWIESQEERRLVEKTLKQLKVAVRDRTRALEKARAAVSVREGVLAVVSHDLKSPLTAIVGATGALKRMPHDERTHRLLSVIERSSTRMERMLRDLLDAASIDAGKLSIERKPNSIRELVSEAVEAYQSLAASKHIAIRMQVPGGLPSVACDGQRIVQVLTNLVGNAVKFTPPGGSVTVSAEAHDGELVLWVDDTGPGIPEEDLPHIFDRFYRSKHTRTEGAGLGLWIANAIVVLHGGSVRVASRVGRGTKFIVTLPTGELGLDEATSRPQPIASS